MPWYAFLFVPFALIFRLITSVRNYLFDRNILKSFQSPIATLIVGNLSVGGTGKTPMVEFLIRNLKDELALASLSRGYGRKSKGFIQANDQSNPTEIGDEPLQIFRKFKGEIPVFVGEDRVAALEKIAGFSPITQLVILDDAFQHRRLRGDLYCLLTPYELNFSKDQLMPLGRLRESRSGAKRADVVVVTKCPEGLTDNRKIEIKKSFQTYLTGCTPVFFSQVGYGTPYPLEHQIPFSNSVILVSGLANDQGFVEYCSDKYRVLENVSFPDHHAYKEADVKRLLALAEKHKVQSPVLLTTEKDADKLKSLANHGFLGEIPIFVLPIEAKFDQEDKEMLLSYIRGKFNKQ
ncbi:tetraacyldisaccharide 4'-kinase [Algoriphagus sp.]|uniref:tetraacyldisaccharide 4'-kinase n=1 Tax=Algoriphagus sp. TaxID=1872435 RepID=UPI003919E762